MTFSRFTGDVRAAQSAILADCRDILRRDGVGHRMANFLTIAAESCAGYEPDDAVWRLTKRIAALQETLSEFEIWCAEPDGEREDKPAAFDGVSATDFTIGIGTLMGWCDMLRQAIANMEGAAT